MGRQIAIAQSPEDEEALLKELNDKYDLLSLPKFFKTSSIIPVKPGQLKEDCQMIFLATEKNRVLNNISKVVDSPDTYHIFPYTGLCIEWERTKNEGKKNYSGRFYFVSSQGVSDENEQRVKKVFSFIISTIKKKYPARSDEKYPTYVGQSLFNAIIANQMELNWGNGESKNVVSNGK